ncbi:MAG: VPLPA-CTERM sorting domain-containing protein [Alphaproteobacteria bacterium]
MKQTLLVAALLLIGSATSAKAATIQIDLGATALDVNYSITGVAISPNIDISMLGSALVRTNAFIIDPPVTVISHYIKPSGSLYGDNYLAVKGVPTVGSAVFSLSSLSNNYDNFGFTWGTIDHYNTLLLTDSRGVTYSVTGSDILALISGSIAGTTQSDVNFTTKMGTIITAAFLSTENSFEVGNFAAHMPLPAALPLFGMGLLGLAALRRSQGKA